jgi:outer membrane protein OmpA-like peptidoglycan-associated protein
LPAHYKEENWKIWIHPFFHSHGITQEMMKKLRHPLLKQYASVWTTTEKHADKVTPLRQYPQGDDIVEMGYVQVEGRDNAPEEEAVMEAVYHANQMTGAGYVLIMKRHKLITTSSVLSFGTVLNAYAAVGPSGKVDENLVTGGGGSGIGRSKSYVDRNPVFRVICFNKAGDVLPSAGPTKPLPPAEYYVSQHTPIYFAFNESKIRPIYEGRNNQLAIEDIALAISKAYENLLKDDEKVFFMGGCDIRGSEGYNDTLGMERGKSAMMAVASLLNKKYGMAHEKLKELLRYGSLGGRQPQFDKHLLNRRVDVVKGSDLIVEYAHLPLPPYATKKQ